MKTFVFVVCVATVLLACHKKEVSQQTHHSSCVECAHTTCAMTLSVCVATPGCQDETVCLLDCSSKNDDVAFKLCAIDCLNNASAESTAATKNFVQCFSVQCEPTCGGVSI